MDPTKQPDGKPVTKRKLAGGSPPQANQTTQADLVIEAVKAGNLGKAITMIDSCGVAPITQDVFDQIGALLNPQEPRPINVCISEHSRQSPRLRNPEVAAMLRKVPKRSARDAYGWTYEHLQQLLGHSQGLTGLKEFLNCLNGGGAASGTITDLNILKVTPLLKGTKGKIRPITVGTTLKRFALSAILRSEKTLAQIVGSDEFAIGRKSAIETLKRTIENAIFDVHQGYGKATVFQLDCSCAFNRMPRDHALEGLARHSPHLLTPVGQWLVQPLDHIVRRQEGNVEHIVSTDGLPQGCPSAPLAFSLGLAKSVSRFWQILCNERGIPANFWQGVRLLRYLDDITLICPPEIADETYHVLRQVLTEDGMLLNEDKCIAFTSDGSQPDQETSKKLWENATDHSGFIVCGFPSTYEDQTAESPVAFPIGNDAFVGRFLEARLTAIQRHLRGIVNTANAASPSLPIRQALNCVLRSCITQKCGHLIRALPPRPHCCIQQKNRRIPRRCYPGRL